MVFLSVVGSSGSIVAGLNGEPRRYPLSEIDEAVAE